MSDAEVVAELRTMAKEERDFVAHAEANRDDWYATMPVELSETALRKAEAFERAADAIERAICVNLPQITSVRLRRREPPKGVEMMDTATVRDVPCNGCRLCCQGNELVLLDPEHGDDLSKYKVVEHTAVVDGRKKIISALPFKANGDCHYLGESGCTIYADRPRICRTFSCVAFFDWLGAMPAAKRKQSLAECGDTKMVVVTKGREMKALMAEQARNG